MLPKYTLKESQSAPLPNFYKIKAGLLFGKCDHRVLRNKDEMVG